MQRKALLIFLVLNIPYNSVKHRDVLLFWNHVEYECEDIGFIDLECRCQHKIHESCWNRLGEDISLFIFGFTQNY